MLRPSISMGHQPRWTIDPDSRQADVAQHVIVEVGQPARAIPPAPGAQQTERAARCYRGAPGQGRNPHTGGYFRAI
jgi:hypothetical protein